MAKPEDTPAKVRLNDELGQLVESTGLLACVDDAYQERGDWAPLVQAFADAVQSAERERCAQVCKMLAGEADGDISFRDACHE